MPCCPRRVRASITWHCHDHRHYVTIFVGWLVILALMWCCSWGHTHSHFMCYRWKDDSEGLWNAVINSVATFTPSDLRHCLRWRSQSLMTMNTTDMLTPLPNNVPRWRYRVLPLMYWDDYQLLWCGVMLMCNVSCGYLYVVVWHWCRPAVVCGALWIINMEQGVLVCSSICEVRRFLQYWYQYQIYMQEVYLLVLVLCLIMYYTKRHMCVCLYQRGMHSLICVYRLP